jgi:hypothetical protein
MNILIIENEKSPLLDKNLTVEIFLDNKEVIRKGEDERYTKRFSWRYLRGDTAYSLKNSLEKFAVS